MRGEPFDIDEKSTNGVQMIPPVKNAGTDAWRNPDDTHIFDHKVTAEMTKKLQSTKTKQSENPPQNETEEEESEDQITDASKQELQGNLGGNKIYKMLGSVHHADQILLI